MGFLRNRYLPLFLILPAVLLCVGSALTYAQGTCAEILKYGIWEKHEEGESSYARETFYQWFRSLVVHKKVSIRESGGRFGFAIQGVPISASSFETRGNAEALLREIEREQFSEIEERREFRSLHRTASSEIAAAWQRCVDAYGLQWKVEATSTEGKYLVSVRFHDVPPQRKAKVINFVHDKITCNPNIDKNDELLGGWKPMTCTNSTPNALTMTLEADKGDGLVAELQGVVKYETIDIVDPVYCEENAGPSSPQCALGPEEAASCQVQDDADHVGQWIDKSSRHQILYGTWSNSDCHNEGSGWHVTNVGTCSNPGGQSDKGCDRVKGDHTRQMLQRVTGAASSPRSP